MIEVVIADERWSDCQLDQLGQRASEATLRYVELDPARFEIGLLGCDDAKIALLNAEFRGKPAPTNVLSWPSQEYSVVSPGAKPELPAAGSLDMPAELGDIAIAYETCVREAAEAGLLLGDHVLHLLVHATLHLLGYDHIREEDAALMEGLETEILATIGVPDPYC